MHSIGRELLNSLKYLWEQGSFILFIAMAMMLFSSCCGLGFTYDSYDYLAAARNLREQQQLLNADGSPFIFHAPLFPIVLSTLGEYAIPLLRYINLLLLMLSLLLIGKLVRSKISNTWIFNVCLLAIGMSAGTQMIHHFIWSEPLFLTFFAAHNLLLIRYLDKRRKADLYGLILTGFFLAITRNAGFFFLLPTSLFIYLYFQPRRLRAALSYLLFGSSGFVAWNVHVTFIRDGAERIYGDNPFFEGFWTNLAGYLDIMSLWFLPSLMPFAIRILLMIVAILFLLLYFKRYLKDRIVVLLGAQSLFYVTTMIALLAVDHDEIERLLAVIYPWITCALCMLIDKGFERLSTTTRKLLIFSLIVWGSYVVIRGAYNNIRWHYYRCNDPISYDLKIVDE